MLPFDVIEDQWCLVALDDIPQRGFRVPGLSVYIPGHLLDRVASTAIVHKLKTYMPLHFSQNKEKSSFKEGFGVYGTPQLPRHVFVGPLQENHVETHQLHPCMVLFTIVPRDSATSKDSPLITNFHRNSTKTFRESTM